MDTKKKSAKSRTKVKTIDLPMMDVVKIDPVLNFKSAFDVLLDKLDGDFKSELEIVNIKCNEYIQTNLELTSKLEQATCNISEYEEKYKILESSYTTNIDNHESQIEDLKNAFGEQEAETNNTFIQKIKSLEEHITTLESSVSSYTVINNELVTKLAISEQKCDT